MSAALPSDHPAVAAARRAAGHVDLADMAGLIAAWWSRPVPAETALWRAADVVARELARRLGDPSLAVAVPAVEDDRLLLDEYERLFVGPGPVPCPPYESFWRSDVPLAIRRSLMGPCAAEVTAIYRWLGLEVVKGTGELPDHVAVEFEAFACAFPHEPTLAMARQLFGGHLRIFVPRLCRAVARETSAPFYRRLAEATTAWLAQVGAACGDEAGRHLLTTGHGA